MYLFSSWCHFPMHRHQFKAKPFKRDFNNDGLYGVPLKRTFELTRAMTPDFASKKVIKKRDGVNDEQETSHKDMYRQFRAQPVPDFTAVKVSVVVQLCRSHACHMSDFNAVSVWSGTTCMHMPIKCLASRQ